MKCPKCGYLGFESGDRCRNCGYDFSLSPTADLLELPLKTASPAPAAATSSSLLSASPSLSIRPVTAHEKDGREARASFDDLPFLDSTRASEPGQFSTRGKPDLDRPAAAEREPLPPADDLPLFGTAMSGDLPLITKPSAPRPPLAVRRATPDVPRLRSVASRAATLNLGLEPPPPQSAPSADETRAVDAAETHADDANDNATIGARFVAVVTDLLILAAIDVAVVYFTMQICGIAMSDLGILPRAPLLAFLLVQNGGYLVAFTAGGRTLGKMAAGIKVVSIESDSPIDLGRAFVRELVWLVLAAPAGLGLLTVLSRDHRGVHDRFAGTRVIRG
jgi:uncharacterized RDD family membrane protein YckC